MGWTYSGASLLVLSCPVHGMVPILPVRAVKRVMRVLLFLDELVDLGHSSFELSALFFWVGAKYSCVWENIIFLSG